MIKPHNTNTEFELGGINHVALVCSDMAKTVDFYSNVLGMPLVKSLDLPGGAGQHFFFDAGNGDCVAFFWFADAPDRVPGISSPGAIPGIGDITSAVSTMNHLAFHVPAEKFDAYRQRLKDKGVRVGPVLNHDESPMQVSATVHPGVYVRSFYFQDPDGITLEFACWVKEFDSGDARAVPKTAADRRPRWAPGADAAEPEDGVMTDGILTDEQIAALTPEQRRELVSRLKRPLGEVIDPEYLARMRRIRLSLMIGGSMAMIPWLGYLSVTLPENYVAHNWPITWIGFDVLLVGFMLATAVLGYLRRQLLGLAAFTTGVLLICDAWFDLMTAGPKDVWLSVITALLIEVPLAVFMILSALRITRLTMMRLWLLRPGMRLWDLPLFP